MKTFDELRSAIWNNLPLVWNDPYPIEGNDYTITYIEPLTNDMDEYTPITIQYEDSEAQVYLHEIIRKN